ncbi:hypothetical protein ABW19_dt0203750 [Dactylella cylindrospora]|nr:hypothetical protein ABW19_dt0203750 [Dactylella cylindrospora]
MPSTVPSVPRIPPAFHHAGAKPKGHTIDPNFFGPEATIKPTLAPPSAIPSATPSISKSAKKSPTLKTPIPAKSQASAYSMTLATPVPTHPTGEQQGVLGWGMPAEIAFFVSLTLIIICVPLGLFIFLRRRKRQSKGSIDGSQSDDTLDLDGTTTRGSFTRPPTASSWLEMLKHRTETPSPPHAGSGDQEVYYEPPKPLNFARRKFYTRKSGRMSAEDIEREIRELDEEVRRRSKMSKLVRAEGVIPDVEDPCGECAMAYTYDERGHTQPVEGRKATPVPFLGSVEIDGCEVFDRMKYEVEGREQGEDIKLEIVEDKVRLEV